MNDRKVMGLGGLPERSDADLVRAVRRGDKRAFVEIVARYQAMVCGVALGILQDFAASEDAAQEAFLTAWKRFDDLRDPERLRGWLAQIARNSALMHRRKRRTHDPIESAPVSADESPGPDETAVSREETALVCESLEKLPEIYRLPLILYYREGQSIRAVADALEISEDTARQRLTRGRSMLRDQLSGVIETVLTRTRPTAVFTMAIAVAIGALAAPSVIAGGAFSGTTAAAAATPSTSSSASLFTLMSTSKSFLVASALVAVACIPIGYQIPVSSKPVVQTNTISIVTRPKITAPAKPDFENSAFFAKWRELHDQYGTNAAAMPLIYKAIGSFTNVFERRAFHSALVAEWVQIDASSALQLLLGSGREKELQRQQFIKEWMALDANAAATGLLASKSKGENWQDLVKDNLPEFARRAPARVPDLLAALAPIDPYWQGNARDAFAILAESDLAAARQTAEKLPGENRIAALAGIAQYWAKNDLDAAIAWAKSLPGDVNRNEIIRAALVGRARVDPVGALEHVDLVPGGGRQGFANSGAAARVLVEAANTDFETTLGWLTAHPGRFGEGDLRGLSGVVTDQLNADAAAFLTRRANEGSLNTLVPAIEDALMNGSSGQQETVWNWLKTQPNNDTTKALKTAALDYAGYQNPVLAMQLAKDVPNTAEGDAQIKELAGCLLNGGNALHRFDQLYAQAQERLRQPLLLAAFHELSPDGLDNPQRWADRLSQLPEASRPQATESLAKAWAGQSPQEALNWASSLPSGDTRNETMAGITLTWAKQDPHEAAQWVGSLSPGIERDKCATVLVRAMADRFPNEAWQWTLNISDAVEQTHAATAALSSMAKKNPAAARQWLETSPFPPETRTQLQAALNQSNGRPASH